MKHLEGDRFLLKIGAVSMVDQSKLPMVLIMGNSESVYLILERIWLVLEFVED